MKKGNISVIFAVLAGLLLSGQGLAATAVLSTRTYAGNWFNDTYGSTGSLLMEASINYGTNAAALTIDLGGNVFGGVDPDPVVLTGLLDPGTQIVTVSTSGDPVFGDVSASANLATGTFGGLATPSLGTLSFGGGFNDSALSGGYVLTNNSGALVAFGHMHASVVPIPSSLLLMLSGVAVFAARVRRRA